MISEFGKGLITGAVLGGFSMFMLMGVLFALLLEMRNDYDEDDDQE